MVESHCALSADLLTQTTVLQHDIDTGNRLPIMQHAYRMNPTQRAQMQKRLSIYKSMALLFLGTGALRVC